MPLLGGKSARKPPSRRARNGGLEGFGGQEDGRERGKMAKGDGCIIEKSRGVYEVQISYGCDPLTGYARRVSKTVHGTKADARKVRDAMRKRREEGATIDGSKMRFSQLADEWLALRMADESLSESTKGENAAKVRFLKERFGNKVIGSITPAMVERYYSDLKSGKAAPNGKSLAGTSVDKYHRCLSQILERAVNLDYIVRNPCARATKPKCAAPNRSALDAQDAQRLLALIDQEEADLYAAYAEKEERAAVGWALAGRSYLGGFNEIGRRMFVRVALATGMRRGEILALTWADVDLKGGALHVRHSLTAKRKVKAPKTKAGVRTIALDADTLEHLERWRSFSVKSLRDLGARVEVKALPVICSAVGAFSDPNRVSQWWVKWRGEHGFDGLKVHELRHTHATQLIANGVDFKTVQTRLGHSKASITLDMYTHAQPENDRKAANLIGGILHGKVTPIHGAEALEKRA